ncbi:type II toxin-antitoxin system RelE/ParE family toxin [Plastoroseomonas arctica]|uniref:Type II toxin-antitoxin system RelE/ParE family toxin n=1 Tax=Plastoroseomonas arctica TaxID=1509237 RepID=A0AAF1JZ61_9PROT|nr:type II toxin-antitoxin system RelE/ParE family toxin [Plastoroseomonas arctica]MBR0657514.1 type II toxin-antitoxin system RelE/ParE family toxin [Plastoroseomonas arctica]
MARIEWAPEVFDDFERFLRHMAEFGIADRTERIGEIIEAIQILAHSPAIGRPVKAELRELIIGRASRGSIALFRFVPDIDTVFILAIRTQREAGG